MALELTLERSSTPAEEIKHHCLFLMHPDKVPYDKATLGPSVILGKGIFEVLWTETPFVSKSRTFPCVGSQYGP